jgi:hypothetical protein
LAFSAWGEVLETPPTVRVPRRSWTIEGVTASMSAALGTFSSIGFALAQTAPTGERSD